MRKGGLKILIIILISFLVGIYFYSRMPEKMASHWNSQGEVNGYTSKFWGLFLAPILSVGLFLLFVIIPKIDPLKENIEKFRKFFDSFIFIIILFLFFIYLLTIAWNLGFRFNFIQLLVPAFSLLFYYAGILIENAKKNWFIGIRTPWTLSNERVWDKTHKIGGKLFKITAAIALFGIFFKTPAIFLIIVPVISISIYLIFYSYFEYKKGINLKD